MEYRQTDGKTRRVHKQYVDVVARILAGGQLAGARDALVGLGF